MKWFSLAVALVAPAQAALRFGCSSLSVQRLDPIVQPGAIPSTHIHQIVGGNAFNATMDPNVHPADIATCTTCFFSEDFSNYWTAVLYFKARNGSYKRVPQYENAQLEAGSTAGMTIYYTQQDFSSNGNQKISAFKPGFRMTVGSPTSDAYQHHGLRYTCLQTKLTRFPETPEFPAAPCPAGIMAAHHFPACWDGKNIDSPDHQSHMYNTAGDQGFVVAGACPSSHPVRVPQVAFETLWDTRQFNDKSLWPTTGQPFVWSTGDSKGYTTHADYLFGWKGDALQRAMDSNCMFDACGGAKGPLKTNSPSQMNACTIKSTVKEPIDGWVSELPGRKGMD